MRKKLPEAFILILKLEETSEIEILKWHNLVVFRVLPGHVV